MAICGRKTSFTCDFLIFSKNVDMGSALQSVILCSKQFVKNNQTSDLEALKCQKLGKSQNSCFSDPIWLHHFGKRVFR